MRPHFTDLISTLRPKKKISKTDDFEQTRWPWRAFVVFFPLLSLLIFQKGCPFPLPLHRRGWKTATSRSPEALQLTLLLAWINFFTKFKIQKERPLRLVFTLTKKKKERKYPLFWNLLNWVGRNELLTNALKKTLNLSWQNSLENTWLWIKRWRRWPITWEEVTWESQSSRTPCCDRKSQLSGK